MHEGRSGRSADQDDFIEVAREELGVAKRLVQASERPRQEWLDQLLGALKPSLDQAVTFDQRVE